MPKLGVPRHSRAETRGFREERPGVGRVAEGSRRH